MMKKEKKDLSYVVVQKAIKMFANKTLYCKRKCEPQQTITNTKFGFKKCFIKVCVDITHTFRWQYVRFLWWSKLTGAKLLGVWSKFMVIECRIAFLDQIYNLMLWFSFSFSQFWNFWFWSSSCTFTKSHPLKISDYFGTLCIKGLLL